MDGSAPVSGYRPAEVARLLRCSEWWIKEQARRRRIPYAWIGGSYLFTDVHVGEIVRLFEVRPSVPGAALVPKQSGTQTAGVSGAAPALRARKPRRSRGAAAPGSRAA